MRLDFSIFEFLVVLRVDVGIVLRGNFFGRDYSVGEFIYVDFFRCVAGVELFRDIRFR